MDVRRARRGARPSADVLSLQPARASQWPATTSEPRVSRTPSSGARHRTHGCRESAASPSARLRPAGGRVPGGASRRCRRTGTRAVARARNRLGESLAARQPPPAGRRSEGRRRKAPPPVRVGRPPRRRRSAAAPAAARAGSMYPSGSAATRMPRWTWGCEGDCVGCSRRRHRLRSLHDGAAAHDARRPELEQRHDIAIVGERARAAAARHEANEGDRPAGRRGARRAELGRDVDAAVLPGRVWDPGPSENGRSTSPSAGQVHANAPLRSYEEHED